MGYLVLLLILLLIILSYYNFVLSVLLFSLIIIIFIIYLLIDLAKSNPNAFMDKWVGKTRWIWLPFYALQRLIKEVIIKK